MKEKYGSNIDVEVRDDYGTYSITINNKPLITKITSTLNLNSKRNNRLIEDAVLKYKREHPQNIRNSLLKPVNTVTRPQKNDKLSVSNIITIGNFNFKITDLVKFILRAEDKITHKFNFSILELIEPFSYGNPFYKDTPFAKFFPSITSVDIIRTSNKKERQKVRNLILKRIVCADFLLFGIKRDNTIQRNAEDSTDNKEFYYLSDWYECFGCKKAMLIDYFDYEGHKYDITKNCFKPVEEVIDNLFNHAIKEVIDIIKEQNKIIFNHKSLAYKNGYYNFENGVFSQNPVIANDEKSYYLTAYDKISAAIDYLIITYWWRYGLNVDLSPVKEPEINETKVVCEYQGKMIQINLEEFIGLDGEYKPYDWNFNDMTYDELAKGLFKYKRNYLFKRIPKVLSEFDGVSDDDSEEEVRKKVLTFLLKYFMNIKAKDRILLEKSNIVRI